MFDTDSYLKRMGGSLAQFTGTTLGEIEMSDFARRAKFVALWLDFLKGIKEAGFSPDDAEKLVATFLSFEGTPQVVTGGTLEVGGQIVNVKETELGLDVGIEFGAPNMTYLGGSSAGLDLGVSFRREDKESVSQNFRAMIRWMRTSGPVRINEQGLLEAATKVLEAPTITWPDVNADDVSDSSDLLTGAIIPFLTGVGVVGDDTE